MEEYCLQLPAHTTGGGCFVNTVCLSSILSEVRDIKKREGKGKGSIVPPGELSVATARATIRL